MFQKSCHLFLISSLTLSSLGWVQPTWAQTPELVQQYQQQAETLFAQAQYEAALNSYTQALKAEQSSPSPRPEQLIELSAMRGLCYFHLRQFEQALETLQQAEALAKKHQRFQDLAEVYALMVLIYNSQGNHQQALVYTQQQLEAARQSAEPKKIISALNSLIDLYLKLEQPQQALSYLKESLSLAEKLQDDFALAIANHRAAEVQRSLKQFNEALSYVQRALSFFDRLLSAPPKYPNPLEEQQWQKAYIYSRLNSLMLMGDLYDDLEQYAKAIEVYQQVVAKSAELKDINDMYTYTRSIALDYFRLKDYTRSIEVSQQALKLAQELNNPEYQARTYYALGLAYDANQQYKEALDSYQQALEGHLKLQLEPADTVTLYLLVGGSLYNKFKKEEEALKLFLKAEVLAKNQAPQQLSSVLSWIATVWYGKGDYQQALGYAQQALNIAKEQNNQRDIAVNLNKMASLYNALQDHQSALPFAEEALEIAKKINDEHEISSALSHLASIYQSQGYYDKALALLKESLILDRKDLDPERQELLATTLMLLGMTCNSMGHYSEAQNYYQESLVLMDKHQILSAKTDLLINRGFNEQDLAQYPQALTSLQQALALAQQQKRPAEVAKALHYIGSVYIDLDQYEQALKHYQQAKQLYQELNDQDGVASILNNLGLVYDSWGKYTQAIQAFEESLSLSEKLAKPLMVTLGNLGGVYQKTGQYSQARQLYEKALALSRQEFKTGSIPIAEEKIAGALKDLGGLLRDTGEIDKALAYTQEALGIYQKLNNQVQVDAMNNTLASFYTMQGNYDKAEQIFKQSLNFKRQIGDRSGISGILNNLAGLAIERSDFETAQKYLQEALQIAQELNLPEDQAFIMNSLAILTLKMGADDQSLKYLDQASKLANTIGQEELIQTVLNNYGLVYQEQSRYDKAQEYFSQSLERARQMGLSNIAPQISNLGMLYQAWGQYDKALNSYQEALKNTRQTGNKPAEAMLLNNLGMLYQAQGNTDKALETLQQALERQTELGKLSEIAVAHNNLNVVYATRKQPELALEHLSKALELYRKLGSKKGLAIGLNGLGMLYYDLKDLPKAIENLQQALTISQSLKDRASTATILDNLGSMHFFQQQYAQASQTFEQAVQLKEELRKTATGPARRDYLASQIASYQFLSTAWMRQGKAAQALETLELSKAKLLSETLARQNQTQPKAAELQKHLTPDTLALVYANTNTQVMSQLAVSTQALLAQEIPVAQELQQIAGKFNLKLAESAPVTQISFSRGSQSLARASQPLDSRLEQLVMRYCKLLKEPASTQAVQQERQNLAKVLYQLLIKPQLNALQAKKELLIIPDGVLAYLPFETLIDDQGKYLVESYSIRYAPSLGVQTLLQQRAYPDSRKPLLAFGGAVYDGYQYSGPTLDTQADNTWHFVQNQAELLIQAEGSLRELYGQLGQGRWANLPGTLAEVQSIQQTVPQTEIVTGEQVNEQQLKQLSESGKLGQYKILHFASHGLVVPEVPELSALVMSQFKTEQAGQDGYLRMGEIAKLKLQADFVNLSACETGLGKIYTGEGVVGLTQAFLSAGANGVSASLWQVSDEGTALFMKSFYGLSGDYAERLTEIKRQFLRGHVGTVYQDPYYWAPFVYYGK